MLKRNIGRHMSARTLVAGLFASVVLLYGAWAALWMAPQQLRLARHAQAMPPMDAAAVAAAEPGTEVLVTGVLVGNPPADHAFITYTLERWEVKTDAEGVSKGRWVDLEAHFPDLRLMVEGQPLRIRGSSEALFLGDVPVQIYSPGGRRLSLDAYPLEVGTLRYRGLRNGDQVTVLGRKEATGDIMPARLFLGDRAAFVTYERNLGRSAFLAGLCVMAMAPLTFAIAWALMGW